MVDWVLLTFAMFNIIHIYNFCPLLNIWLVERNIRQTYLSQGEGGEGGGRAPHVPPIEKLPQTNAIKNDTPPPDFLTTPSTPLKWIYHMIHGHTCFNLAYMFTEWWDLDEPCSLGDVESVIQSHNYAKTLGDQVTKKVRLLNLN
jgi:hypothetical protein